MKLNTNKKTFFLKESNVIVELKIDIPKKLYKYFSINEKSLENLKNNKVHFSHPFNLNDIMEGNTQLWDLKDFIKEYQQNTNFNYNEQQISQFINQELPEEVFKHRGVLCLTTNFNNNLFWPHYTSETGICIEYNSDFFLQSFKNLDYIIFPMDYKTLDRINFNEYIITTKINNQVDVNVNLPIIYSLSVKDKIWEYEEEWRIVIKKDNLGKISHPLKIIDDSTFKEEKSSLTNRNITYNPKSIEKIIFSTLFFSNKIFNKIEKNNGNYKYYFREGNEIFVNFFYELKKSFYKKLYQVDRNVNQNGEIISELLFKIEIVKINNTFVIIKRKNNNDSI